VSAYWGFGLIVLWLGGRLLNGKKVENPCSRWIPLTNWGHRLC